MFDKIVDEFRAKIENHPYLGKMDTLNWLMEFLMSKKIAVAVIHGMGNQKKKKPNGDPHQLHFSGKLWRKVRREIGAQQFEQDVIWREVFWADVLSKREEALLEANKNDMSTGIIRKFVLHNLGDAAAYRNTGKSDDATYVRIHRRVRNTLSGIRKDVGEDIPLIVLAHSLGGHIMSNYIYDTCDKKQGPPSYRNDVVPNSDLENFRTLAAFVTFGCNIPIFTLAFPHKKVCPITYPGVNLPQEKRQMPWWINYHDRSDVLGFPLRNISPKYQAMAARNELNDRNIDAGPIGISSSPLSHNFYWTDRDFYKPVAKLIGEYL